MVTAMASLDAKRPWGFPLAIGTPRARHVADFGAAVSMGNVCRSLLYELLDVLSPDLATVLPHAGTSFSLGSNDEYAGLTYFLMPSAATSPTQLSHRSIP